MSESKWRQAIVEDGQLELVEEKTPDTNDLIVALAKFNQTRNEIDKKSREFNDRSLQNIKIANEIIDKYKTIVQELVLLIGIMEGDVKAPFDKKLNLIQAQFEMIAELENQRSGV